MNESGASAHYSMVLQWEPEGGVSVVSAPELPGCRTHGETPEIAVRQGEEIIALWLDSAREDGRPIPPPRYVDLDPVGAAADEPVLVR